MKMKLIDKAFEVSKSKRGWEKMPDEHRIPNIISFLCPGDWFKNECNINKYGDCNYDWSCEECWNKEI